MADYRLPIQDRRFSGESAILDLQSEIGLQSRQYLIDGHQDAAVVLELHQDLAGQHLVGEDPALSLARHDPRADRRQLAVELFVDVLLEAQAALEPAAA